MLAGEKSASQYLVEVAHLRYHLLVRLNSADNPPLVIKDTVIRGKSTTLCEGDGRPHTPVNRVRGAEQSKGDGDNEGGLGEHGDVYDMREKTDMNLSKYVLVCEWNEVPRTSACYLCMFGFGGPATLGSRSETGRAARRMGSVATLHPSVLRGSRSPQVLALRRSRPTTWTFCTTFRALVSDCNLDH